jgi:hypothetical protein
VAPSERTYLLARSQRGMPVMCHGWVLRGRVEAMLSHALHLCLPLQREMMGVEVQT